MSRPAFAIYVTVPTHDYRDGIIGWSRHLVRYCETADYAKKIAAMLDGEDSRDGGDCSFDVYRVGSNRPLWQDEHTPALAAISFDDEVPF
jgi:hypothetical protein